MKKIILTISLYVISFPVFSRLWGLIARIRYPRWLSRQMIRWFARTHKIDMTQFEGSREDYPSLSRFFVRPLDPRTRPLITDPGRILSPADGRLQEYRFITGNRICQVKNRTYRLNDLFRSRIDFSEGWHLTVIYLSPSDYHRFHYPLDAMLTGYCHPRGRLYPVNRLGMQYVDRLFVKNERVILRFEKNQQSIFFAAVGASFVGSIQMTFSPRLPRAPHWHSIQKNCYQLKEMGRFGMGSTIVLLVPESLAIPLPLRVDQSLQTGIPLFRINQ